MNLEWFDWVGLAGTGTILAAFLLLQAGRLDGNGIPYQLLNLFDTVTLAGIAYGQTVLARAVQAAGMEWNQADAHSAVYDAERTAALFCRIANAWPR